MDNKSFEDSSFDTLLDIHDPCSKPHEPGQRRGQEFPCKEKTSICVVSELSIILTFLVPQILQQRHSNLWSDVSGWVATTLWPINPSQTPVRVLLPKSDANKRWQVMFISITWSFAQRLKNWEVGCVGHHFQCKLSVHFEPLRPFSPLLESDERGHADAVTATSNCTVCIKSHDVALGGVHQVRVDCWEVEERNARLWYQNKALVREIQKGIRQKPTLSFEHAEFPPFHFLHYLLPE